MTLFQWGKKYEIGLPKIDQQHRMLFDMLNTLYLAKKSEQSPQVIEATLARLLQYTRDHFADEETAMREAHYPDLDNHHNEHLDLTDQVLLLQEEAPVTFELLNFMNEWLRYHILKSDCKFGDFMRERQSVPVNEP